MSNVGFQSILNKSSSKRPLKFEHLTLPLDSSPRDSSKTLTISGEATESGLTLTRKLVDLAISKATLRSPAVFLCGSDSTTYTQNGGYFSLEEVCLGVEDSPLLSQEICVCFSHDQAKFEPFLISFAEKPVNLAELRPPSSLNFLDFAYFLNTRVFLRPKDSQNLETLICRPQLTFTLEDLPRRFRFASCPLTRTLLGKEKSITAPPAGFLTIDSKGRILPSPFDMQGPANIVGVWASTSQVNLATDRDRWGVWGLLSAYLRSEPDSKLSLHFESFRCFLFLFDPQGTLRCYSASLRESQSHIAYTVETTTTPLNEEMLVELGRRSVAVRRHRGVQTDRQITALEAVLEAQQRNEDYFRMTLTQMQEQITLLARAVESIQSGLTLLSTSESATSTVKRHSSSIPENSRSLSVSTSSAKAVHGQQIVRYRPESSDNVLQELHADGLSSAMCFDDCSSQNITLEVSCVPSQPGGIICQQKLEAPAAQPQLGMGAEAGKGLPDAQSLNVGRSCGSLGEQMSKMIHQSEFHEESPHLASIQVPKINSRFRVKLVSADNSSDAEQN